MKWLFLQLKLNSNYSFIAVKSLLNSQHLKRINKYHKEIKKNTSRVSWNVKAWIFQCLIYRIDLSKLISILYWCHSTIASLFSDFCQYHCKRLYTGDNMSHFIVIYICFKCSVLAVSKHITFIYLNVKIFFAFFLINSVYDIVANVFWIWHTCTCFVYTDCMGNLENVYYNNMYMYINLKGIIQFTEMWLNLSILCAFLSTLTLNTKPYTVSVFVLNL